MKLAPFQLEALANAICGGEGTPMDYRSGEQAFPQVPDRTILRYLPDVRKALAKTAARSHANDRRG
jgi:hypothetical protein